MTITRSNNSATVTTTYAKATVALLRWNAEGRQEWGWSVSYGDESEHGSDLRTGVGFDETPENMLRTLASFLSAHSESSEGGECADLFVLSQEATGRVAEMIYFEVGWDN